MRIAIQTIIFSVILWGAIFGAMYLTCPPY